MIIVTIKAEAALNPNSNNIQQTGKRDKDIILLPIWYCLIFPVAHTTCVQGVFNVHTNKSIKTSIAKIFVCAGIVLPNHKCRM